MMRAAPARRAPCTMLKPTPPSPITNTVAPLTRAVCSTAPTPVCTAQPTTHATSSGTDAGTFTAPLAGQRMYSAKPPRPTPRNTIDPRRDSPVLPSANVLVAMASALTHTPGSPRTHQ